MGEVGNAHRGKARLSCLLPHREGCSPRFEDLELWLREHCALRCGAQHGVADVSWCLFRGVNGCAARARNAPWSGFALWPIKTWAMFLMPLTGAVRRADAASEALARASGTRQSAHPSAVRFAFVGDAATAQCPFDGEAEFLGGGTRAGVAGHGPPLDAVHVERSCACL